MQCLKDLNYPDICILQLLQYHDFKKRASAQALVTRPVTVHSFRNWRRRNKQRFWAKYCIWVSVSLQLAISCLSFYQEGTTVGLMAQFCVHNSYSPKIFINLLILKVHQNRENTVSCNFYFYLLLLNQQQCFWPQGARILFLHCFIQYGHLKLEC